MSLYHVPHIALGAEMTEDVDDRSALVAYRQFFGNIGALFTYIAFFWLLSPFYGGEGRFVEGAYVPWAILVSIVMGATIFWSAWGTRSVIPFLQKVTERSKFSLLNLLKQLGRDFKEVTKSKNFRFLFTGI